MPITIFLFLLGFVMLIKGGDWFVDGAVAVAHRFHLPELLIGATIVSIGTTLPEVMVSSQAALQGNAGISYGNAIGSIICNTSLIAALTIAIRPGPVPVKNLSLPSVFFAVAALFYAITAWTTGEFHRWQGLLFLAMFVVYIICSIVQMKNNPEDGEQADSALDAGVSPTATLWKEVLLLAIGAAVIAIGAHLLVSCGTQIAQWLGVPESVIGLTAIALGTSLPELVTAITSLAKGHGSLSLGNVIGANLFNLVLVSGAAISLSPFKIPAEKVILGVNSSFVIDLPIMLGVMALLCIPAFITKRLHRYQGILLLCCYGLFTVYQFIA